MVEVKVTGKKMVITADLTGTAPSKSGKSILVATTSGFVEEGGYKVALNVIKAS